MPFYVLVKISDSRPMAHKYCANDESPSKDGFSVVMDTDEGYSAALAEYQSILANQEAG